MNNEKGITLIELLGVLVILSIVLTFIGSILVSSLKTSERATSDQRLQQEANYITEKVRNEFLKKVTKEGDLNPPVLANFELTIDNDNNRLLLNDEDVISEGYTYSTCVEKDELCDDPIKIDRTESRQPFQMKLISKDKKVHIIDTQLSKLK